MKLTRYVRQLLRRAGMAAKRLRYLGRPEKIVARGYDEMAADYGSWTLRHERPDRDKYTRRLIELLPDGAELLELGCGPGEPTTRILAERFRVTANDISASCLELARRNAPGASFVQADMTELEFPADRFDAVVAYYAFHHVPRERYAPLINNIAGWLRPGGLFMAAFYPYDVENLVTDDWHGATMYWSSYGEDRTIGILREAGLDVVEQSRESAVEDGRETTFLWLVARRPATAQT